MIHEWVHRLAHNPEVTSSLTSRQPLGQSRKCAGIMERVYCMWLGDPGDGFYNLAVILSRQSTAVCSDQRDASRLNRTAYFRSFLPVKWPNMIPDALGGAIGYSCSPRHLCEWQLPPPSSASSSTENEETTGIPKKGGRCWWLASGKHCQHKAASISTNVKELKHLFITRFIPFTERL